MYIPRCNKMNCCFPCFNKEDDDDDPKDKNVKVPIAQPKDFTPPPPQAPPPQCGIPPQAAPPQLNYNSSHVSHKDPFDDVKNAPETDNHTVKSYTFRELATATKNFRQEYLLGEGAFGRVFKGTLSNSSGDGQIIIRQLNRNGVQPSHEFVTEVSDLSFLRHPNLVKIVGYCADGEQRILVYEYMPAGSLKKRLFELSEGREPLDWLSRMKIALGIAEGLEFLHEKADTPVIYRDLKSSNILLTEDNKPKLSDYGLAKLVKTGNKKMNMCGDGYNAPEYERQGELTLKSDVYSFGVVMLELITGRQALDTSLPDDEQKLVSWAQPIFKDPTRFPDMADPLLQKQFPIMSLNQAVGVAAMCLQEEPMARPLISDISGALSFLAMPPPLALPAQVEAPKVRNDSDTESESESEDEEPMIHRREDRKSSSDFQYNNTTDSDSDSLDDEVDMQPQTLKRKSTKKKPMSKQYSDSSDDEVEMQPQTLKRKSTKKKAMSKKFSRLSSKSSRSSSSSSSSSSCSMDDLSVGFSLRCDSDYPLRSDNDSSSRDDDSEAEEHYIMHER